MSSNFEVVVGTYEQFLLGYKVDKIVDEYKMEQTFATHSHLASIRSVASNKHYLASGGADETVCLYDMRYRTENGKLMHHSDSVNCITFTPDASHILTGSSDGSIGVIRCGNWQVEKLWQKPHKGLSVEALAVHPSGKIALSTGGDGVLRTWNLVKGKLAYATNLVPRWKALAKNINIIKWSPNGEKYLIASNNKLDVYSVETAGIDEEIQFDTKIICVEFLNNDLIAIGFDNGKICFYDVDESVQTLEIAAHDTRLKCMQHFDNLLVTASSSGEIKLWSFTKDSLILLNRVTCNSRILCLSLASPCKNLNFKKQEVEVDEVATVKKVNKLRMRQEVIIEDEGDELSKDKIARKSKKGRLNEAEVDKREDILMSKKKKKKFKNRTEGNNGNEEFENGMKRPLDEEAQGEKIVVKKKKKLEKKNVSDKFSPNKRKQLSWIEEEVMSPVKRKRKKVKSSNKDYSQTEIIRTKKRKTRMEEAEFLPKNKKVKNLRNENAKHFVKKKKRT